MQRFNKVDILNFVQICYGVRILGMAALATSGIDVNVTRETTPKDSSPEISLCTVAIFNIDHIVVNCQTFGAH